MDDESRQKPYLWTPENLELLKRLWAEGHSAGAISLKIPRSTRSAIIGKVRRLNLPFRVTKLTTEGHVKQRAKAAKQEIRRPVPVKPPSVPATSPAPAPKAVEKPPARPVGVVGSTPCRWPIGDVGSKEFRFCGDMALSGKPYCADHCERAYVRVRS